MLLTHYIAHKGEQIPVKFWLENLTWEFAWKM